MIKNFITKTIISITLILIILAIGIILHKFGRPYNNFLFTIHKLTTIAFVVLIIKMIIPYVNNHGLKVFILILIALASISILGLIVSGGAMSLNKSHELMLIIHRISTFSFLLALSGIFYTFFYVNY